ADVTVVTERGDLLTFLHCCDDEILSHDKLNCRLDDRLIIISFQGVEETKSPIRFIDRRDGLSRVGGMLFGPLTTATVMSLSPVRLAGCDAKSPDDDMSYFVILPLP